MRETAEGRARRAVAIDRVLGKRYADRSALSHRDLFQLLVAVILSAQCTDRKVNQVTPSLFRRFPDPRALAGAALAEVEELVRPTGFYRQKARALVGSARGIVERYGGEVPRTLPELITLPGVGRKTANVVLGNGLGVASGVVVDTHVKRLAARMGLTDERDPEKVEADLMGILPRDRWISFSNHLIFLGREVCLARRPRCEGCPVSGLCPRVGVEGAQPAGGGGGRSGGRPRG